MKHNTLKSYSIKKKDYTSFCILETYFNYKYIERFKAFKNENNYNHI